MTRLLAIDPGYTQSAYVDLDVLTGRVLQFGIEDNDTFLRNARWFGRLSKPDDARTDSVPVIAVIEQVESFGMPVGREVFETVFWSGRFAEALQPIPVERLPRRAVKLHLCGTARAKDSNIRQALIDRYGGSSAIGRKATPGPLYGISGDVWAALAVAVTWADTELAA